MQDHAETAQAGKSRQPGKRDNRGSGTNQTLGESDAEVNLAFSTTEDFDKAKSGPPLCLELRSYRGKTNSTVVHRLHGVAESGGAATALGVRLGKTIDRRTTTQ